MFTTMETRAEKVGSTWLLRTVLYKKSETEKIHNKIKPKKHTLELRSCMKVKVAVLGPRP